MTGYIFQATLATIHNSAENKIVADLVGSDKAWIGGFSRDGNIFFWPNSSDTKMNYQNWNFREPNNSGGNEYCVEIYGSKRGSGADGKWNDNTCNKPDGYVCETSRDTIG